MVKTALVVVMALALLVQHLMLRRAERDAALYFAQYSKYWVMCAPRPDAHI